MCADAGDTADPFGDVCVSEDAVSVFSSAGGGWGEDAGAGSDEGGGETWGGVDIGG